MTKFLTLMAAMAMLASSASPLYAKTINCKNDDLQKAIDAAEFGAELKVRGTCEGQFFIRKSISLIGPATLSNPKGGFAVLRILDGGHGTLEKLTIDGSGNSLGIQVQGSTARIVDVVSENADEGLRLDGASFANIDSSEFRNNRLGMLVVSSASFNMRNTMVVNNTQIGILIFRSSSAALFSGNLISGNGGDGITIQSSGSFSMSGSTVTDNGNVGVNIDTYSFVFFFDPPNTIEDNTNDDVRCNDSGGLFVSSPQISATQKTSNDGTCIFNGRPIF